MWMIIDPAFARIKRALILAQPEDENTLFCLRLRGALGPRLSTQDRITKFTCVRDEPINPEGITHIRFTDKHLQLIINGTLYATPMEMAEKVIAWAEEINKNGIKSRPPFPKYVTFLKTTRKVTLLRGQPVFM